jgi:KaiC/GvpD/RAD55 family RecA-like ATPase
VISLLQKITTGIHGLDRLLGGGFRRNSCVVVTGSSGTGKTLFSLQYLLKGLHNSEYGLYITLEEEPEQIIEEACLMGWVEIEDYAEEGELFFISTRGRNFKKFIFEHLPSLVEEFIKRKREKEIRVVIDPLTPLLWAIPEKANQREILLRLFSISKEIGTVVATVEQHTVAKGDLIPDKEVTLPIFLSDYAIIFQFLGLGAEFNRGIRIIKTRGSSHVDGVFPLQIVDGFGLVVISPRVERTISQKEKALLDQTIGLLEESSVKDKKYILRSLEIFKQRWVGGPCEDILNTVLFDLNILG